MSLPQGLTGSQITAVVSKAATGATALKTWTKITITPRYEKFPYEPANNIAGFIGQKQGYDVDVEFLYNETDGWPVDVGDYIRSLEIEEIESGDSLIAADMLTSNTWGYLTVTEAPRTLERGAATGSFKAETGNYRAPA